MNTPWPLVPLGEVLTERREVPPDGSLVTGDIPIVAKICFNDGKIELRTDGQTKTGMILICPGDLVVSGINAAKGAIAIYGAENTRPIAATIHYGAYMPDQKRVDIKFLWWLLRSNTFREILAEYVPGGIKTELKAKRLLPVPIPLPPLPDQRRIVAYIDSLSSRISEARSLQQQTIEEAEVVLRSILMNDKQVQLTPMRELVKLRLPDVTALPNENYQFAGVYCFGRGVFKATRRSGMDFAYPLLTKLRAGDFVYPKLMAWEGALGVVPPECDGCVVSTEFPVFEVLADRVAPEVLDTYFRMPSVWPELSGVSTGTNVRRRRLNPQSFLNYKIPLPSRETQIVIRTVRAKVDALKRLHSDTSAELDALLPSMLDRAFEGKL